MQIGLWLRTSIRTSGGQTDTRRRCSGWKKATNFRGLKCESSARIIHENERNSCDSSALNGQSVALFCACRRCRLKAGLFTQTEGSLYRPLHIVPADGQHFEAHLQPVAQRADLGAMIVCPFDRDFDRAQLELVGQEQQLRIEAPALNPLPRKNGMSSRRG